MARSYYTSSNSNGYTAYGEVASSSYAAAIPSASSSSAFGFNDAHPQQVLPLECMNRNARKPSKANHGARPNSSYNRKSSSPEFGSWRHPGLRPGQSPPPRPQPGTPMTIATVGVGAGAGSGSAPTQQQQQQQQKAQ